MTEVQPEAEAQIDQQPADASEIPASEQPAAEPQPDSLEAALEQIRVLNARIQQQQQESEELKDQVMRLNADFSNFRRRKERESADAIRFANQELVLHLLPVLDNFDRTLDAIEKTDNLAAIKEGISLVGHGLNKQLQKIGLEPIESMGKAFDAALHEAISAVPVEDAERKGTVIDVAEKGYRLKDKVIRVCKVIVGE
ncbi:MAG: nucleotide exchange factor GrpE [Bacteroidia bacterium]|nr:nucleotide exchange factor GrpE [Bacteroidia bacterium]